MFTCNRSFLILIVVMLFSVSAIAQQDTLNPSRIDTVMDSIKTDTSMIRKIRTAADALNEKLKERYRTQLAQSRQEKILASLRAVFQRARDFMKTGLDTFNIKKELDQAEHWIDIAGEGIFTNIGSIQTSGNLSTSAVLLTEIGNRNENREKKIDDYLLELENFRTTIDSLASDSLFLYLPTDTADIKDHLQSIQRLAEEIKETDNDLNISLRKIRFLKIRASIMNGNIQSKLDEIQTFRQQLSLSAASKETPYLWESARFHRPFPEIIKFSRTKTQLVMFFYVRNHANKFVLVILVAFALYLYLRSLKRNIVREMGAESALAHSLVLNRPVFSSMLICFSIGQFLFPSPPFSFYGYTWLLLSVILTVILLNHITSFWMKFWITSVLLSVAACGINLVLQASRPERVIMLLLSAAGAASGLIVLFSKHRFELKEKRLLIFLWITVGMEIIAFFGNLYGRYNMSKGMMTTGFFSLVVGLHLLWTVRLVHEIFDLSAEAYREDEKKRFYIDFDKVGSEVPLYLYIILGVGWFTLIARNFYIYTKLSQPLIDFLGKDREIGAYSFNLSSILLFVAIIFLSGIVSKLVSYFADNRGSSSNKKSKIGNWMLLIRIGIFSIGIFLAFAATGIPMDRIAIVFGALSVGIGFGLQTLVNNLVSGLIIAFEKPINVGDVVEIGGRSGTMKSIGFRSSVVTTFDGSEVIIPNGDLLNQHLINWTLNDNPRRVEVLVGVNYGTNLDSVVQMIYELMEEDQRIRKTPNSFVLVNNFGNSSIDLRVLFWVSHYTDWQLVRSELMQKIKRTFDEKGIEIPYPQMVLHSSPSPAEQNHETTKPEA